ncbi:MAG: Rrf2 family transcriptional regulator [Gemmatimonadota bacterium]|nr:Rrf2 family transcriptional regulator [Gemmatimonadota bacterium]
MRFTTQAEYGLICALHLAKNGGDGPVAAREMSEIEGLPSDYTEKILRRLRQAGLVNSIRGVSGGFELARAPEKITVRDVIVATEGTTFEVNCETHKVDPNTRCGERHDCSIRPVWLALKDRIDGLLDRIRLSDLVEQRESEMEELIDVTWEDESSREATPA